MRPLRVFLCHASQDKPAVRKLHRYLKQHGVKPWLDQEDLLPGEDWEVEIPKTLFASDVILVCLSKNSVNKEGFVQKEITFALDKAMNKPEGTIFIIPVKLEDCDIPKRLARYQWVDLSRADGRRRLLMGLNKRVTELGPDVSPVILDETRKTPKPEKKKPEEQVVSAPLQEEKEPEVKFAQPKPFTEFLDPSSLSPQKSSQPQGDMSIAKTTLKRKPMRWLGIGGIFLLVLIFGGIGLNYLVNNPLVAPATPSLTPTKTFIPTPTLDKDTTQVSEKDGMILHYVPAGQFMMGSDNDNENDNDAHAVYLDAFWIDQTEVTNGMYAKCVSDGKCTLPEKTYYIENLSYRNLPVVFVDWNMAAVYCSWAGRRLPTEAEWEKAARGGLEGKIYPWGDEEPICTAGAVNGANFSEEGCPISAMPVGSFAPNGYGLYDMAGNVWEWVSDKYSETYYGQSPLNNPTGPETGKYYVLRGGSWNPGDDFVISAFRLKHTPTYSYMYDGFRCALSAK